MRWSLLYALLVLGASMLVAGMALAQEVTPPEDQDTIEPGPEAKPRTAPKDTASEEHTVVNGDTLWDLCGRYLNNPWYWPRVWSYNPEISNPHWIFPGQVVRFYPGGEGPGELDLISRDLDVPLPEDIAIEEEGLSPEELISGGENIVKIKNVTAVRILRDAFVTRKEIEETGTIRASREEVEFLHEGSVIYVDFKDLTAVQVGQQVSIFRTERPINHPVTGELVGYHTHVLGVAQIINIAETSAVAQITTSTDSIIRGDRVGPLMDKQTKEITPRANEVELRGYILGGAVAQLTNLGESHLVFIDQGTEQGVKEGNLFDVVRREDSLFLPGMGKEEGKWDKSMPAEIWGRVMIVDARPNASTGLVMASVRELRTGDRVLMSLK